MKISDYEKIVGSEIIEELNLLAKKLKRKVIQNINSTRVGGGVAEMLHSLIPLLQDLGIDARWDVIRAEADYFNITKAFHNALHGRDADIRQETFDKFTRTGKKIIKETEIYGDIVFIHDPQPIALIEKKRRLRNKWIWRCHVDVSRPNREVWDFLVAYINKYNAAVFSSPKFAQSLPIEQFLIYPSINPFDDKNRELMREEIEEVTERYNIKRNKPIITQVSRFDRLKDPAGVIDAYGLVKKYIDCQLILAGNRAADDPETDEVLFEIKQKAKNDPDIHILLIEEKTNDMDINAIQRISDVVLQKSLKEGFALTVTEALWKAKPVVASSVGGIPLQIKHNLNGLLCYTVEGAALHIRKLLQSPEYAMRLGKAGRRHVIRNFLSTRHLRDYMLLFLYLYQPDDIINL